MSIVQLSVPVKFDLERRTQKFARAVRAFVKQLPRTFVNQEDVPQLIRASGSVAANYIEANEALGRKDFLMRIKICLKEAKESAMWLTMLDVGSCLAAQEMLLDEAKQLTYIFSAILTKAKSSSQL